MLRPDWSTLLRRKSAHAKPSAFLRRHQTSRLSATTIPRERAERDMEASKRDIIAPPKGGDELLTQQTGNSEAAASFALARPTFSRISSVDFVHASGRGFSL